MSNPNALINEKSRYLRQHAHNPVDWKAWNDVSLALAREQDRLLLVSIGYSACHWCHVMERESFKDVEVARLMNRYYVSIKVDREELPDVDQYYMDAVQLMGQQGGWPLNVICLPDGRPLWGATYVPRERWIESLKKIAMLYQTQANDLLEFGVKVNNGIKQLNQIASQEKENGLGTDLAVLAGKVLNKADMQWGGRQGAPKFPMPDVSRFMLRVYKRTGLTNCLDFVALSCSKMAEGGIYDRVGGGFARYSVDGEWKVPHFEKMLYDNAQLISLYAELFAISKKKEYARIAEHCVEFILDKMTVDGGFTASIDADSSGGEGSYYSWTRAELIAAGADDLIMEYWQIGGRARWEGELNLLLGQNKRKFCRANELDETAFTEKEQALLRKLKKIREQREAPERDDKVILAWHSMMISALVDAWQYLGRIDCLDHAVKSVVFVEENLRIEGEYQHTNSRKGGALLDDLAHYGTALLQVFLARPEKRFLALLSDIVYTQIPKFKQRNNPLYFRSPEGVIGLSAARIEVQDNVCPSSNAVLARLLHSFSHVASDNQLSEQSAIMINAVSALINEEAWFHAHWGMCYAEMQEPFYELLGIGKGVNEAFKELRREFLPNVLILGLEREMKELEWTREKEVAGSTMYYLCQNKSCHSPEEELTPIVKQIGLKP